MSFISEIASIKPRYEERHRASIINRYATVDGKVADRQAFSQLWQCFAWAAVLGFINNRSRPLEGPTMDSFPFSTIQANGPLVHKALICAALAKAEQGIEVLREPRELIRIIEQHANGGFELIAEILEDKGPTYFDNFDKMLTEVVERGLNQ